MTIEQEKREAERKKWRDRYQANREKILEQMKIRRQESPELTREANRKYRAKYKDKVKEFTENGREAAYIRRNKNRGPVVLANHLREVWR